MWHGVESMGWGWIGLGFLHMGLFWILVILAIVVLVRWLGAGGWTGGRGRALDILQERYAKGELTREQYEEMKRALRDERSAS